MNFLKILEVELIIFIKSNFVILKKKLRFNRRKMIFLDQFEKLNDPFEITKNLWVTPDFW